MVSDHTARHPDKASLMMRSLECDPQAVNIFLDNLSSAYSQQCKALQETIHDLNDPLIWYQLLHYLAHHRWENQVSSSQYEDHFATDRIDQAITEVFTQDESADEKPIKDTVLHEVLDHPEDRIQYAAAYILGLRHDSRSIPVLAKIVDEGNKKWKFRAIRALSVLKDKDCAPPLMKALVMDRSKLHREARRALQNLGPLAEQVWIDALNQLDNHIRWEAAHGLGQIGDARASLTLAEGLFDENYVVRWTTAKVLAQLGSQGVPATLTVLSMHEIDEPFRQAAYYALRGINSPKIREQIKPVLKALNNPTRKELVSCVAQDVLLNWKKEKMMTIQGDNYND